ncbi:MAG: FumA C-terminus/TtdB family hydratase beta subunit [archaeon]
MTDFTKLKAGDRYLLSGTIFTARDKAHLYLLENHLEKITGSIIYHCGPIIKDNLVIAAGPTTSSRLNPYTPKMLEKYNLKAIIGKGGMDRTVLEALKGKAVYFAAVGGAALVYAKKMTLISVHKPEFGMPEAIWELVVKDLPLIVAMDSEGNSLYDTIKERSEKNLLSILSR